MNARKLDEWRTMGRMSMVVWAVLAAASLATPALAEDVDFRQRAIDFANDMIQYGRDDQGAVHTPLFSSQLRLDGGAIAYTGSRIGDIPGIREGDRSVGAANPAHHVQLHELLARLTADGLGDQYAQASRDAIQYAFRYTRSPNTNLLAWGEHISWDLHDDSVRIKGKDYHEPFDRWSPQLWQTTYEVAPDAGRAFAQGLWDHQIHDQTTGDFSRHATYTVHNPRPEASFPRVGGYMIQAWAQARSRNKDDAAFDAQMRTAINTVLDLYLDRRDSTTGAISAYTSRNTRKYWMTNNILLAIETQQVKHLMTPEAAAKADELADSIIDVIVNHQRHNFDGTVTIHNTDEPAPIGFHTASHSGNWTDERLRVNDPDQISSTWGAGYGSSTTAQVANLLYLLAEVTDNQDLRHLARQGADVYLTAAPDPSNNLHPIALAAAIDVMLNTYELTDDERYLERAIFFGNEADQLFFAPGTSLPTVTSQLGWYEAITGGDDLMLAFHRLGATIPEPTSLALLGVGGAALMRRRRGGPRYSRRWHRRSSSASSRKRGRRYHRRLFLSPD